MKTIIESILGSTNTGSNVFKRAIDYMFERTEHVGIPSRSKSNYHTVKAIGMNQSFYGTKRSFYEDKNIYIFDFDKMKKKLKSLGEKRPGTIIRAIWSVTDNTVISKIHPTTEFIADSIKNSLEVCLQEGLDNHICYTLMGRRKFTNSSTGTTEETQDIAFYVKLSKETAEHLKLLYKLSDGSLMRDTRLYEDYRWYIGSVTIDLKKLRDEKEY